MMDKAPDAYRTISEVAEDLDIAQHVLRFWETRFPQIKPLKRGGGRRYYRPDDVELLKGIRHLLYKEGYTIKGVQRILKDQGTKSVQTFGRSAEPLDWADPDQAPHETIEPLPIVRPLAEAPPPAPAAPDFWPEDRGEQPEPAAVPSPVILTQPATLAPARPPQVANFRGGLARQMAQTKPAGEQLPLLSGAEPVAPVVAGGNIPPLAPVVQTDRRTQLLGVLDDIEACRALVAAARAARPR